MRERALSQVFDILDEAKRVLEFYSNASNYGHHYSKSVDANEDQIVYDPRIMKDKGELARELLSRMEYLFTTNDNSGASER